MRPISPDTKSLIERLNPRDSFWTRWQGSPDDVASLRAIGDSNEPAAIIDILPFALSQKRDVARAAAVAVRSPTVREGKMGRLTTVPTELPSLTVGLLTRSIDHHEKELSPV